jgi:hypothetical protein
MTRSARKIGPKSSKTTTISTVLELPGAIFHGDAINDPDALNSAVQKQRIRADFEATNDINALWDDLTQLDFCPVEISQCVTSPAKITNCGYGWPAEYQAAA